MNKGRLGIKFTHIPDVFYPIFLLVLTLLTGCGGGESSPTTPVPTQPTTPSIPKEPATNSRLVIAPVDGSADIDIDGVAFTQGSAVYTGFIYGKNTLLHTDSTALNIQADTRYMLLGRWDNDSAKRWTKFFGNSGARINAYDISATDSGHIFASGSFSGSAPTLSLDNGNNCQHAQQVVSSDSQYGQSFLSRFDHQGNWQWSVQSQSAYFMSGGNEVALGPNNTLVQIHTAGRFGAASDTCQPPVSNAQLIIAGQGVTLDFSDTNGKALPDTIISIHDRNDGDVAHPLIHIGGAGEQKAKALATSKAGQAHIVVGIDIEGPTTLYSADAQKVRLNTSGARHDQDVVIAKYSYHGDLLWYRSFGSNAVLDLSQFGITQHEEIKGVGIDSKGDVYAAGTLTGDVAVGNQRLQLIDLGEKANSMAFVTKLDKDTGEVIWFNTFGGSSLTLRCCELAIDGNDVIYLTPTIVGDTFSYIRDGIPLQRSLKPKSATTRRGMVIAIDSKGQWLSYAIPDTTGDSSSSELAIDGNTIAITGVISGNWQWKDALINVTGNRAEYLWLLNTADMTSIPAQ